ncbi:MAG: glycosyltransferase family 4 protein [Verrucomicrobiales bacterium]
MSAFAELTALGARFGDEQLPLEATQRVWRPPSSTWNLLNFNAAARRQHSTWPGITIGFGRTSHQDIHRAGSGCHRAFLEHQPSKPWKVKNAIELHLEKQLYTSGNTGAYVVNSPMVINQLTTHYGVPEEKIVVLPTPVDHSVFYPAKDDLDQLRARQKFELPTLGRLVLYAGLDHRRKGLSPLLKAWRALEKPSDLTLVIAGAEVREPLPEQCVYLGRVGDMGDLMRAVDLFVLPTLYDACSNASLQALATGLGCALSIHDGAIWHGGGRNTVFTEPEDWEAVLYTLSGFVNWTDEEIEENARVGIQAMGQLTWENHCQAWVELIHRVAQEKAT